MQFLTVISQFVIAYVLLPYTLWFYAMGFIGWPPFGHESIGHEPLIALEQWKASRHRSLWLVVSNWAVSKRDASHFPTIDQATTIIIMTFLKSKFYFQTLHRNISAGELRK